MADYRQLLTRAISALTENNGAARREVYEKARKALVAQLRSITPPLPAREITQHRLELEDCIRQVEQEATESILGNLKHLDDEPIDQAPAPMPVAPEPEPVLAAPEPVTPESVAPETVAPEPVAPEPVAPEPAAPNPAAPQPAATEPAAPKPLPEDAPEPAPGPAAAPTDHAQEQGSTPHSQTVADDPMIADQPPAGGVPTSKPTSPVPDDTTVESVDIDAEVDDDDVSSIDAIIARAEAARTHLPSSGSAPARKPAAPLTPDSNAHALAASESAVEKVATEVSPNVRREPAAGAVPQSTMVSDRAVSAATTPMRDVEIETPFAPENTVSQAPSDMSVSAAALSADLGDARLDNSDDDSQLAIDRAIEMLDREARGETDDSVDPVPESDTVPGDDDSDDAADANMIAGESRFVSNGDEEKGGNALMIFLVIAVVLLGATGAAGYWAWQQEYIDLDALFAQTDATGPAISNTGLPADAVPGVEESADAGPGNTVTDSNVVVPTQEVATIDDADKTDERLATPVEEQVTPAQTGDEGDKAEDRLTSTSPVIVDPAAGGSPDAAVVATSGAQSLLLEASADGTTGAVPFSGTVGWERGVDELGQPTLIGTASIPARNLSVDVLIRRNADPTLPASHLVEIEFDTSETFVGGSVASFVGILFKNEELVPGRPLVGAPARVFENMFLFALSSAEQDVRVNIPLIESNKWMDLAIIYGTGRQAIITLEKDEAAQQLFDEVLTVWQAASAQSNAGET